jgi:nascent polypeptide-associated complex subunit alpha
MADDAPHLDDEDGPPELDDGSDKKAKPAGKSAAGGGGAGGGGGGGAAGGAGGAGGGDEEDDEEEDDEAPLAANATDAEKQNRNEKKARKAIQKLGMKQVPGVTRVSMRRAKGQLFVMNKPDVYKSPGTGADVTYILFGEAKVEDANPAITAAAMEQFQRGAAQGGGRGGAPARGGASEDDEVPPGLEGDDAAGGGGGGAGGDSAGVEEKDIELVMAQADCTRERAIAALKKHDSDIVNSIMELTNA